MKKRRQPRSCSITCRPSRFDSHSAVELAFTAAGRRHVADRAAARDLALFVRSRQMHTLRKLHGEKLDAALKTAFGSQLARSHIRYRATADGAIFTERSPTGRVFKVVIRYGRIAHQNLKPHAFVF